MRRWLRLWWIAMNIREAYQCVAEANARLASIEAKMARLKERHLAIERDRAYFHARARKLSRELCQK